MRLPMLLLLPFALAACDRGQPVRVAAPMASTSQAASVGGATLQASTVALADLTPAVASRYGIATGSEGVLLLVTVRDADGNALAPGDLALQATASVLPDPPAPLALREIRTGELVDYIGEVRAKAPASVQFRLSATRGGLRAEIATTAELHPR